MTTDVVTRANFRLVLPDDVRARYWEQVERTLRDVFDVPPSDAADTIKRYKASLADAPIGEQILAYHDHPLSVAANLAGIKSVTERHQERYRDIEDSDEPKHRGTP